MGGELRVVLKHRVVNRLAAIAAFDVASAALVAFILSCGMPFVAYAYVDPSVMTYTIQAIAGVAVALAAVAGVALRRTRRWLMKKLGIDENAHKEVEGSVHRREDGLALIYEGEEKIRPQSVSADTSRDDSGQLSTRAKGTAGWRTRAAFAFAISFFVVFTLMIVGPFETVGGAEGSLTFALRDVWSVFVLPALVALVVLTTVLSIVRGKAYDAVLLVVFGLGVCCYLQALFLNGGLPQADGRPIDWSEYVQPMVVSAIVWIAVVTLCLVAGVRRGNTARRFAAILSVALIIVQGVGVASLFSEDFVKLVDPSVKYVASEYQMTDKGMYSVSNKSNVIVFVLDMYDTSNLEEAVASQPDLLDEMKGFTWFTDSLGSMIPTRYGLPFLLTGQYPQQGEKFSTFLEQRYERSSFLSDIDAANYSIGVYSDTLGQEYMKEDRVRALIYDHADNILPPEPGTRPVVDSRDTFLALMKCSLYRDLPWVAKPPFWYYTDEVNKAMVDEDATPTGAGENLYIMDDARWFEKLKAQGLSLEEGEELGAFRFIHLSGAHYPFNIDESGTYIGEDASDIQRQSIGSMRMTAQYLRQLKEIGAYDCSTIIITADHGTWYLTDEALDRPTSPILLVKPARAADIPCRISTAPVSSLDVLPTVMEGVEGADADKYGRTVFDIAEGEQRDRLYYETTSRGGHDWKLYEYVVRPGLDDMENWVLTGAEWAMQE